MDNVVTIYIGIACILYHKSWIIKDSVNLSKGCLQLFEFEDMVSIIRGFQGYLSQISWTRNYWYSVVIPQTSRNAERGTVGDLYIIIVTQSLDSLKILALRG